jgi:hypothetical protein
MISTPLLWGLVLRFKVTKSDTGQRDRITEVAISAELGRTFFDLVETALKTAEPIFSTQHFASPWELEIHAESKSGGEAAVSQSHLRGSLSL